jgi:two-component system KDP operon response regulator KdpE
LELPTVREDAAELWTRSMTNVLVIDNEAQIRRFLRAGFELHGYAVMEAENAASGLRDATIRRPDLIILDVNLPDLEGSEVLERIRSWSNVPIIVLSIVSNEHEKVRLLRLGADDYVVKPFGLAELLARSEAALRRQLRSTNKDPVVRAGPLSIDLVSRVVTLEGKRVQLTRKEYALLHALATHSGLVVTHQQLIKDIWGNRASNIQYLRILVRKLRQKVEPDATRGAMIVSESGVGYRLDQGATESPRGQGEMSPEATSLPRVHRRLGRWKGKPDLASA